MRAGRGVLHEEMWETSSARTTKVELFQLWVNLPSSLKMSAPCIRYVGEGPDWSTPYTLESQLDARSRLHTRVRTFGDDATLARAGGGQGAVLQERPPVQVPTLVCMPCLCVCVCLKCLAIVAVHRRDVPWC